MNVTALPRLERRGDHNSKQSREDAMPDLDDGRSPRPGALLAPSTVA
jgi:hypothetical protein